MVRVTDLAEAEVLIVGLGMTGKSCAKVLSPMCRKVWITDAREDLSSLVAAIEEAEGSGARFIPIAETANLRPNLVVVSPGLAPVDERLLTVRRAGGEWVSEIEIASRIARGRIVAVTGTNGKTSSVTMAGNILKRCCDDVRVSGNIGHPFIEAATGSTKDTLHIVEVSSYQLELCRTFSPQVGVVLNVQPDHLARHRTIEEYARAKARMLGKMKPESTAVLNRDDRLVEAMANITSARIAEFSVRFEVVSGTFLSGGSLVAVWDGIRHTICREEDVALKGSHNIANVLAVSAASIAAGAGPEDIRSEVVSFAGLPHRLESLGEIGGVDIVNDSKATNIEAVLAAMETFDSRHVTLILNGDDKGFDYTPLKEAIVRSGTKVVVLGPGLRRVADEFKKTEGIELKRTETMLETIETGLEMTVPGGVLLLSPSSSSFDLYENYEERGTVFRNEIERKKNS